MLERELKMIDQTAGLNYSQVAILRVSGAMVIVGTLHQELSSSVFVQTDEIEEPVLMSTAEAEMLIAALRVSINLVERGEG